MVTMHIRRKLARARGNSFYRDKSFRGRGCVCGAPETLYDIPWCDRNRAEIYLISDDRELCPDCMAAITSTLHD